VEADSNNNRVLDSTFTNLGRGGLFLDHSTGGVAQHNSVSGSGLSGTDALDIEFWNGSGHALAEDNTVDHWISFDGSSASAARRNTFRNVPPAANMGGLETVGSQDMIFTDNVAGSGVHGLVNIAGASPQQFAYWARNVSDGAETWGAAIQTSISRMYFYAKHIYTH